MLQRFYVFHFSLLHEQNEEIHFACVVDENKIKEKGQNT